MTDYQASTKHIVLTSHPDSFGVQPTAIHWGHPDPLKRGPVIATLNNVSQRNAIGTHTGSYAVYRALAVAQGLLETNHRPDFSNTAPAVPIGPHPSWSRDDAIVSLDPFGAVVCQVFTEWLHARLRYSSNDRGHQSSYPYAGVARGGRAKPA